MKYLIKRKLVFYVSFTVFFYALYWKLTKKRYFLSINIEDWSEATWCGFYYSIKNDSLSKIEEQNSLHYGKFFDRDPTKSSEFKGTCNEDAWKLGNHQKVISYSFYDKPDKFELQYWRGFNQTLNDISTFYPGWQVRVYATAKDIMLLHSKVTIRDFLFFCDVNCLPPPLYRLRVGLMMWRFASMGDPQVDILLVRDLDSPIIQREVDAVTEWLSSNKTLHVMRDHPYHKQPIMGGLWGIKINSFNREKIMDLKEKMFQLDKGKTEYLLDQNLLKEVLWPKLENDYIGHDSYHCEKFNGSKSFPTKRKENSFVGQRYGMPAKIICPIECRPEEHQDWEYC